MGINGINELIKRHAPEAFFSLSIARLTGKRIAIDADGWMCTSMAISRRKVVNNTDLLTQEVNMLEVRREWFMSTLNLIYACLDVNVIPIFVFDGQAPIEKEATKEDRKNSRLAQKAKIDSIYSQLQISVNKGPLIDMLHKELSNYIPFSLEDKELYKIVLKGIGIPCLNAVGEGEQLCAALCIEGKVAAVLSKDTDNLVYGCPLVINKFNYNGTMQCVRFDQALNGLKLTQRQFVDLCIMSGCDYNTNMPGYAAIKSYNLIQKYGDIDNLPNTFNIECLKHKRCRDLFKFIDSSKLIKDEEFSLNIDKTAITNARDYLEMIGVSGQIDKLLVKYNQVTDATDGYVEDLGLLPSLKYNPAPRVFLNIIKK